ncbi:hypothetical protein [Streptomyces sp. 147326]|uniref:hypothetical protein n=1 Tax=Streptomyces sp. 147326 TaxID=3074379 RepID=UPI0038579FC0
MDISRSIAEQFGGIEPTASEEEIAEGMLKKSAEFAASGNRVYLPLADCVADAIGAGGAPAAAAVISEEILNANLIERGPRHPDTLDTQGLL